jgi:hypothetical protein
MKRIAALLSLVSILSSDLVCAQTSTWLDANIRDVSNLDIGFNRRSDQGTWWTDNSFINLVSEMNPDVVRYPAGTQANYWDWREGKFLENTDKSWSNKEVVTIPTFVNALPGSTKAIYVVNMARPTPITGVDVNASEAILKSQSTLNAKITDMLAAIAEFDAVGKLPFAIELGNEFYFGNIESGIFQIVESDGLFYSGWDDANSQAFVSNSKADATEITAKFYLDQCKDVVAAIKTAYPSMKIIITATKGGTSARDRWNNTIFDELQNNPGYTSLKNDTYAVTQHFYIKDGLLTPITDSASSKVAIAEGIEYPISKQSDYNLVPSDYKICITEYGATKDIAEETWASAVRYAAFTYGWIELGDKIEQLDWHYISDNNVINDDNLPMKLAPVGMAVKMLQQAAAEMTEIQEISFSPNPISVNAVSSLYGLKFKSNQKETLFFINTSDSDFSQVQFSDLFTYTSQPTMTQHYSTAPYVSGVYEGHSNIVAINSDVTTSVGINKFSITVIESENETLDVADFSINKVIFYPNPVKDMLYVKTENKINSISIFNINGLKVFEGNLVDNKIDLSTLNSGIYFVKIETENESTFKKIIKN